MDFYTKQHKHYCGIDLHARNVYVCIMNEEGKVVIHQNIKTQPDVFKKLISPFVEDIVVAVECMFTWYWLADFCSENDIEFILGHALYMNPPADDPIPTTKKSCLLDCSDFKDFLVFLLVEFRADFDSFCFVSFFCHVFIFLCL